MATQTDYYALLGVARSATDEQIRSAYRKLARQYHPDVNSASDASERFKAITEAYEVLTDPQRRQRYDMFGSTTGGLGDFGIGDLFETFFGGALRRREPRGPMRGADLRMEIEIDLIDAVQGRERVITVPRLETCERCHGNGAEPGTSTSTCATCNGRGEVRQVQQRSEEHTSELQSRENLVCRLLLEKKNTKGVRVITDRGRVAAPAAIMTVGGWRTALLPELGAPLRVPREVLGWFVPLGARRLVSLT